MNELYPCAWEIRWPSGIGGLVNIRYHGSNAIGDYRASVHPDARSRELVYRDEAEAAIRSVEMERDELLAHMAALRDDADRYRWVRDVLRHDLARWDGCGNWNHDKIPPEKFDAAIDAAISDQR